MKKNKRDHNLYVAIVVGLVTITLALGAIIVTAISSGYSVYVGTLSSQYIEAYGSNIRESYFIWIVIIIGITVIGAVILALLSKKIYNIINPPTVEIAGIEYRIDKTKTLDLSNKNLKDTDISSLSELKNLTMLLLDNNQISDISTLTELKNLTDLYLNNNQISDISALTELKNLTKLVLYNNQISDISALAELKNLIELHVRSNQISDISALSELKNLTYLNLFGCVKIKDEHLLSLSRKNKNISTIIKPDGTQIYNIYPRQ